MIESESDLNALLHDDGIDVVADGITFKGIYLNPTSPNSDLKIPVSCQLPALLCKKIDADSLVPDLNIQIGNDTFLIADISTDGIGFGILTLQR